MIFNTVEMLFPLASPLANITGGLEILILFINIQIFLYFLFKYLRAKERYRNLRDLALGFLFLGVGFTSLFYFIGDYIATTYAERDRYLIWGYLSTAVGAIVCIIITEWTEAPFSKKKPYSLFSGIILGIIAVGLFLNQRELARMSALLGIPFAIIYFIHYARTLENLSNRSKEVQKQIMIFSFGAIIVVIGYSLFTDFFLLYFGIWSRLIADLMIILGANIFLYAIEHLPDFSEFHWIQKIQAIIVLNDTGISLFQRFYKHDAEKKEKDAIIAGGILSVEAVIKEMTGKIGMNHVELTDKSLIFEKRGHFTFVVIADEYIQSLQYRLRQFADEFSSIFQEIMPSWKGRKNVFLPAEGIADRIFISKHAYEEIF